MWVHYLIANQVFVLTLDREATGELIDLDGRRFFQSSGELRAALQAHGLRLKGGVVPCRVEVVS